MSAPARASRRLPWWGALLAAAAGGLLLDVASPGLAWWPAALPAVALVLAASWQQGWALGLGAGAVAGAAFWGPHISWLTLYLGPVPWLGLCAVMLLWYAAQGALVAIATRGLAAIGRLAARPAALVAAQAATVAGLWTLRELVQGVWPYGGFSWGRVAHALATGPLAQAVSWLGVAGLTAVVVCACALPVAAHFARRGAAPARLLAGAAGVCALAIALLGIVPAAVPVPTGALRVAAVQGNSQSGIFDDRESGAVFADHVAQTEALLDGLEAAGESVDLIVWPENSAEFGLPDQGLRSARVAELSERAGAPIAVGSVLAADDGSYTNSTLVWGADGATGARYDKRYPVPFAEYMPNRDFFHALAPDLVDLVQLDYSAGELPAAFDLVTPAGTVRAGIAICFDITFDEQAVAMTDAGAELILAQTNNADFGRTDENAQQLAIARMRAIETGRAVVNISTVGTSAVIAPDGSDLAEIAPYTAGAMVAEVPLANGITPALRFGSAGAAVWGLLGAAGLVAGCVGRLTSRRRAAA